MKRCETCRWWQKAGYAERPSSEWPRRKHTRFCARMSSEGDEPENPPTMALAYDGSAYYAIVLTMAEFGCVMHEEGEPEHDD